MTTTPSKLPRRSKSELTKKTDPMVFHLRDDQLTQNGKDCGSISDLMKEGKLYYDESTDYLIYDSLPIAYISPDFKFTRVRIDNTSGQVEIDGYNAGTIRDLFDMNVLQFGRPIYPILLPVKYSKLYNQLLIKGRIVGDIDELNEAGFLRLITDDEPKKNGLYYNDIKVGHLNGNPSVNWNDKLSNLIKAGSIKIEEPGYVEGLGVVDVDKDTAMLSIDGKDIGTIGDLWKENSIAVNDRREIYYKGKLIGYFDDGLPAGKYTYNGINGKVYADDVQLGEIDNLLEQNQIYMYGYDKNYPSLYVVNEEIFIDRYSVGSFKRLLKEKRILAGRKNLRIGDVDVASIPKYFDQFNLNKTPEGFLTENNSLEEFIKFYKYCPVEFIHTRSLASNIFIDDNNYVIMDVCFIGELEQLLKDQTIRIDELNGLIKFKEFILCQLPEDTIVHGEGSLFAESPGAFKELFKISTATRIKGNGDVFQNGCFVFRASEGISNGSIVYDKDTGILSLKDDPLAFVRKEYKPSKTIVDPTIGQIRLGDGTLGFMEDFMLEKKILPIMHHRMTYINPIENKIITPDKTEDLNVAIKNRKFKVDSIKRTVWYGQNYLGTIPESYDVKKIAGPTGDLKITDNEELIKIYYDLNYYLTVEPSEMKKKKGIQQQKGSNSGIKSPRNISRTSTPKSGSKIDLTKDDTEQRNTLGEEQQNLNRRKSEQVRNETKLKGLLKPEFGSTTNLVKQTSTSIPTVGGVTTTSKSTTESTAPAVSLATSTAKSDSTTTVTSKTATSIPTVAGVTTTTKSTTESTAPAVSLVASTAKSDSTTTVTSKTATSIPTVAGVTTTSKSTTESTAPAVSLATSTAKSDSTTTVTSKTATSIPTVAGVTTTTKSTTESTAPAVSLATSTAKSDSTTTVTSKVSTPANPESRKGLLSSAYNWWSGSSKNDEQESNVDIPTIQISDQTLVNSAVELSSQSEVPDVTDVNIITSVSDGKLATSVSEKVDEAKKFIAGSSATVNASIISSIAPNTATDAKTSISTNLKLTTSVSDSKVGTSFSEKVDETKKFIAGNSATVTATGSSIETPTNTLNLVKNNTHAALDSSQNKVVYIDKSDQGDKSSSQSEILTQVDIKDDIDRKATLEVASPHKNITIIPEEIQEKHQSLILSQQDIKIEVAPSLNIKSGFPDPNEMTENNVESLIEDDDVTHAILDNDESLILDEIVVSKDIVSFAPNAFSEATDLKSVVYDPKKFSFDAKTNILLKSGKNFGKIDELVDRFAMNKSKKTISVDNEIISRLPTNYFEITQDIEINKENLPKLLSALSINSSDNYIYEGKNKIMSLDKAVEKGKIVYDKNGSFIFDGKFLASVPCDVTKAGLKLDEKSGRIESITPKAKKLFVSLTDTKPIFPRELANVFKVTIKDEQVMDKDDKPIGKIEDLIKAGKVTADKENKLILLNNEPIANLPVEFDHIKFNKKNILEDVSESGKLKEILTRNIKDMFIIRGNKLFNNNKLVGTIEDLSKKGSFKANMRSGFVTFEDKPIGQLPMNYTSHKVEIAEKTGVLSEKEPNAIRSLLLKGNEERFGNGYSVDYATGLVMFYGKPIGTITELLAQGKFTVERKSRKILLKGSYFCSMPLIRKMIGLKIDPMSANINADSGDALHCIHYMESVTRNPPEQVNQYHRIDVSKKAIFIDQKDPAQSIEELAKKKAFKVDTGKKEILCNDKWIAHNSEKPDDCGYSVGTDGVISVKDTLKFSEFLGDENILSRYLKISGSHLLNDAIYDSKTSKFSIDGKEVGKLEDLCKQNRLWYDPLKEEVTLDGHYFMDMCQEHVKEYDVKIDPTYGFITQAEPAKFNKLIEELHEHDHDHLEEEDTDVLTSGNSVTSLIMNPNNLSSLALSKRITIDDYLRIIYLDKVRIGQISEENPGKLTLKGDDIMIDDKNMGTLNDFFKNGMITFEQELAGPSVIFDMTKSAPYNNANAEMFDQTKVNKELIKDFEIDQSIAVDNTFMLKVLELIGANSSENNLSKMAKSLKKQLEAQFGPVWEVFVSNSTISCRVHHQPSMFANIHHKDLHYLIWKCP